MILREILFVVYPVARAIDQVTQHVNWNSSEEAHEGQDNNKGHEEIQKNLLTPFCNHFVLIFELHSWASEAIVVSVVVVAVFLQA
jgi:hypothetical protein